jgi:hypothetical protein
MFESIDEDGSGVLERDELEAFASNGNACGHLEPNLLKT